MEALSILNTAVTYLAPPPPLTGSEWADSYRYVASGPFPGKWATGRTPYLREPLDCVTDAAIESIVIMKPTRVGATEGVINNAIGFYIHYDPCQILYVQTSLEEGRKYSNEILMPCIDVTPVLRDKVARERGRKASQTKLHKSFPGGNLAIVGAKSPKGFRMVSKRVVICDDIDGYETNKEGDVISLAIGRAKDYWNKKIILVSNPTTEGVSRIHQAFMASDQRYRHVPCPQCGEYQILKFGGRDYDYGLKWKEDKVFYLCENCHKEIYEYQKIEMDRQGEYRAEAPFNGIAGFHLNPFLCAWHPWADFKKEFLACNGDPYKLMVFVNQWLGEVWKDEARAKVNEDILFARCEVYSADVPRGTLLLTIGIDVQRDRVELEVKGWGAGEESWGIEYKIINGAFIEEKTQAAIDNFIFKTWKHESGLSMGASRIVLDSGDGNYTSQIYAYCKAREGRGVYAVKGSSNAKADLLDGELRRRKDAVFQMVGVTAAKETLAGRLALTEHGPGYMHFPKGYDYEYFKQLFAERPINTKGGRREWRQIPGRRNEAIDINNYNLAALRMYAPDWEELKRRGIGETDKTRAVYKNHNRAKHQDETITVNMALPIILCCDFGKNPLTWVLCQTDKRRVWVFDEIALRNATTMDMIIDILKKYGQHPAGFVVYGSAVGTVRSSSGKSEYGILREMGFNRQTIKPINPLDIDKINAINNMLEDISGSVRLTYHPRCIMLRKDLEQSLWLEDMSDIDRTDFGRGNASDALGYFINYEWPLKGYKPNMTRRFLK